MWTNAKKETPSVNVPILMRVKAFDGVKTLYGWRRADNGKYQMFGYYEKFTFNEDFNLFEWQYVHKIK